MPILERTSISLDLLDVSEEMLQIAKRKLKVYKNRTKFICKDAHEYLKDSEPYNVIFSGWTIHNFEKRDREVILRMIHSKLTKGGSLVLMDKVYPDAGGYELKKIQANRFNKYLPKKVAKAIIAHEDEDASDKFRIDEKKLLILLKDIGFSKIEIVDIVERDIVLIAKKLKSKVK